MSTILGNVLLPGKPGTYHPQIVAHAALSPLALCGMSALYNEKLTSTEDILNSHWAPGDELSSHY
jgi:hypothetical protein